jgi:hypothetical protein
MLISKSFGCNEVSCFVSTDLKISFARYSRAMPLSTRSRRLVTFLSTSLGMMAPVLKVLVSESRFTFELPLSLGGEESSPLPLHTLLLLGEEGENDALIRSLLELDFLLSIILSATGLDVRLGERERSSTLYSTSGEEEDGMDRLEGLDDSRRDMIAVIDGFVCRFVVSLVPMTNELVRSRFTFRNNKSVFW